MRVSSLFTNGRVRVVAMVHVGALPGTPRAAHTLDRLQEIAEAEASIYRDAGVDALLVENMHDVPYTNRQVGPEIVAAMTRLAAAVRQTSGLPTGIQILAGANREALAAALASGCAFIRAEGFVFGHLADEGYMDACAGDLLRYRRQIGADHVAVLADIKKKHSSHAVTSDVSLADTAKAAEFFLADGLIVTGTATGDPAQAGDLDAVREASALPVLVGSGVTADNLPTYWPRCSGVIVGSHLKQDGRWDQPVDRDRVRRFMDAVAALRGRA